MDTRPAMRAVVKATKVKECPEYVQRAAGRQGSGGLERSLEGSRKERGPEVGGAHRGSGGLQER